MLVWVCWGCSLVLRRPKSACHSEQIFPFSFSLSHTLFLNTQGFVLSLLCPWSRVTTCVPCGYPPPWLISFLHSISLQEAAAQTYSLPGLGLNFSEIVLKLQTTKCMSILKKKIQLPGMMACVSYRRQNKTEMSAIRNTFYLWVINIKPCKRSKQLFKTQPYSCVNFKWVQHVTWAAIS